MDQEENLGEWKSVKEKLLKSPKVKEEYEKLKPEFEEIKKDIQSQEQQ